VAKFFKTSLASQILANTGSWFPKRLTSHVLRRTVATRIAEILGDEGDKVLKRVLGHSDGSVTSLYNRYGYVREMRRALELWVSELTGSGKSPSVEADEAARPASPVQDAGSETGERSSPANVIPQQESEAAVRQVA
jgi:hypothetical protein